MINEWKDQVNTYFFPPSYHFIYLVLLRISMPFQFPQGLIKTSPNHKFCHVILLQFSLKNRHRQSNKTRAKCCSEIPLEPSLPSEIPPYGLKKKHHIGGNINPHTATRDAETRRWCALWMSNTTLISRGVPDCSWQLSVYLGITDGGVWGKQVCVGTLVWMSSQWPCAHKQAVCVIDHGCSPKIQDQLPSCKSILDWDSWPRWPLSNSPFH